MLAKIKNWFQRIPWHMFRDVKVIGLLMFLVIVLLISWSGVKVIQSNYGLQKQIAELQQESQVQELQNNNLKLQNGYFNTDQYLELSARQNFGLVASGETELLVPKNVALAHVIDLPSPKQVAISMPNNHQPTYQRNLQAWVDFYLHRQPTGN